MSDDQTVKETEEVVDAHNTSEASSAASEGAAEASGERKSSRRGGRGRGERRSRRDRDDNRDELMDRVVTIRRVSKTNKGGRTMSFAALVVVGDGKGTVGVGYGKSREVPSAIAKGQLEAKKHMFTVPRLRGTIPHPIIGHESAGTVLLRPAAPGTGVIAGGAVRAVLECAGITDILSKTMGSGNSINTVRATVSALKNLEEPQEVAARRNMTLQEVAPDRLLRDQAAGIDEERKAREEAQAAKAAKDGE